MTMLLYSVLTFEVRKAKRKGWFEISGAPELSDYADVGEFINNYAEDGHKRVDGAKVFGFHNNEDVMESDPRFNHEDNPEEPGLAVVKTGKDTYLAAMVINVPEAVLFERLLRPDPKDHEYPPSWLESSATA
jgi:hypothetical protein